MKPKNALDWICVGFLLFLLWLGVRAFAATQTTQPGVGKPWPLGLVTVTTAGTPVQLTVIVGATVKMNCSQLWLKNPSGSATIYLQAKNVAFDAGYTQTLYYLLPGE